MRLVLGVLLGAAGAFAMSRRPPSGYRPPQPRHGIEQGVGGPLHSDGEHRPAADYALGDASVEAPIAKAQRAASPDQLASDEKHKAAERDFWERSLKVSKNATIISFFALLFAGGAFIGTWRAMEAGQEQARVAQAALVASDRPWIKVAGLMVHEVEISGLGVFVDMTIRTQNIGRSPARRAFVLARPVVGTGSNDLGDQAAAMCRRAAEDRDRFGVEGVVFPDGTPATRLRGNLTRDGIKEEVRRTRERAAGPPGSRWASEPGLPAEAAFAIVGCADYTLPSRNGTGQTAFVYDLARNCGDAKLVLPCGFDLAATRNYSGDEIALAPNEFYGFAR